MTASSDLPDDDLERDDDPRPPLATTTALEVRRPEVPLTLGDLEVLKGEAIERIQTRDQILLTLRRASIRATMPEDWVLFRAPEGQVTGYLEDAGCMRVRPLWGIRIFNVAPPEKIVGAEPGEFMYL